MRLADQEQITLDFDCNKTDNLRIKLNKIDVNNITPMQAMNLLLELISSLHDELELIVIGLVLWTLRLDFTIKILCLCSSKIFRE